MDCKSATCECWERMKSYPSAERAIIELQVDSFKFSVFPQLLIVQLVSDHLMHVAKWAINYIIAVRLSTGYSTSTDICDLWYLWPLFSVRRVYWTPWANVALWAQLAAARKILKIRSGELQRSIFASWLSYSLFARQTERNFCTRFAWLTTWSSAELISAHVQRVSCVFVCKFYIYRIL